MRVPIQISFHNVDPSPSLEARIRELAERLERFSPHIMRCHVIVTAPAQHSQQGSQFEIHIDLSLPGKQIAIRRAHSADPAHSDPYLELRDAFRAARRRIQDHERRRRGARHASEIAAEPLSEGREPGAPLPPRAPS